ncbi:Tfp pilus assembly protein FimT/FimU [Paenactinomyces guangxiensis]|uniref:Prepilin-type N-terminal cleavage/methylation domain-containing protein n=1 Tax=Paenactinomyces guangxiensis TaxID=1490290 RepID=A0A7W1WNX0_9BACL|nr:prepilin-type N-terminal cleavage/methylation domain-containing protein [Paenactinomyces guangxiensis]MBA4493271.1 prepilin-type N-terminal cleavage/methylation domain-containing protein [Paenactinomyces guangxiensis]MBH8589878.1 prepilin-type N-terminal cleavage/methylation domain-containing protein [Paenactinomyces guangxiensis]
MNKSEQGYTLAEIITALFVLGVAFSFAIPAFLGLKAQEHQQLSALEAMSFLQGKTEALRSQAGEGPMTGDEVKASRIFPGQSYLVSWKCSREVSLYHMDVEVQWKEKNGKLRKLHLKTHRYYRF